jgi:ethanolamine ammonia-lyase large subunit
LYRTIFQKESFHFESLRVLLAKATPLRSADVLAGLAAENERQRVAAQLALADVPLKQFLREMVVPVAPLASDDEVTQLILESHQETAFAPLSHFTVGEWRDWLLSDQATPEVLSQIRMGITPEMAAAVSKLMRIQDLITVSRKCHVVTAFRNRIGLPGRLSTRLQPNHPTDDLKGILASIIDGLLLGNGDAVIGINPVSDNPSVMIDLLKMIDEVRQQLEIPTQSCVLTHVTTALEAMRRNAPVDLVFQSIAGSQAANQAFGIDLKMLGEAHQAALELKRGTLGTQCMYFETGQGSALSSNAHFGVDAQTMEARAYAVARHFDPLLVNSVVGFIGPEYLYNGKQIIRAGLEDHFCGKLMGLPMGCDICYTNHADVDSDDTDTLLTLLSVAGCTYIMGVPGSDDIMLNYQSTSFHDALYVRSVLGLRPSPEFEEWLIQKNLWNSKKNQLQQRDSNESTVRLLEKLDSSPYWPR